MRTLSEIQTDIDYIEARLQANKGNNDIQRQLRGVWLKLDQELKDTRARQAAVKAAREAEIDATTAEMEDIKTDRNASTHLRSLMDDEIEELDEQKVLNSRL